MNIYMKRNSLFMLYEIAGVPYLLPYGQKIADHQKGIQINSTGVFLWKLLGVERTEPELTRLCAAHYQASEQELPCLEQDIRRFLNTLKSYGMVDIIPPEALPTAALHQILSIGGLNLALTGPAEAFSEAFSAFRSQLSSEIHQTVTVLMHAPHQHPNGEILLRNAELMVMDAVDRYILLFPACQQIYEAQLTKDGSRVTFYCQPPCTEEFREYLFHAIRLPFLYLAQMHDMVVIHSASLLYQDRAWLFSGHSGAGKSTHTGLWEKALQTPLLNGDLNLLKVQDGHAMVLGLPWCGTSGIFTTESYPLGGIVLLKKAERDYIEDLSLDKQQLLVTQRFISPAWTTELFKKNLQLAADIVKNIMVCRLHCTKEESAVETMKTAIDNYLSE